LATGNGKLDRNVQSPNGKPSKGWRNGWYLKETCTPGHTAARDGCTPARGGGGKGPAAKKPVKESSPKQKPAAIRTDMHSVRREGEGKDVRIVLANGKSAPAHITPAMVPPAWKDVQVSLDPKADVLVVAKDAKGNSKVVYSDNWTMQAAARKFSRIHDAMRQRGAMAQQIQQDRKDPKKRDVADCAWLMSVQGTRPGSEADNKGTARLFGHPLSAKDVVLDGPDPDHEGRICTLLKVGGESVPIRDKKAREEIIKRIKRGDDLYDSTYWLKSHGATTLQGRNVKVSGSNVILQFMGKESVYHEHIVRDPALAKMLRDRAAAVGSDGKLFGNVDEVKESKYVDSLDGGKFTPKDLRTTVGTSLALRKMKDLPPPKTEKEYRKACMEVANIVAGVLGNEPAQALESYISPAIFSGWRANLKPEALKTPKKKPVKAGV
jgi:DNA topoisomerase IB